MRAHNLCSPLFLGLEVNKAVFACVCLEKGGFLDFFQLLSYRIFSNLSMFLLSIIQYFPPNFFSNKTGHQKIRQKLTFPKETQAKRAPLTSTNFLTQRWSAPLSRRFSWKCELRERCIQYFFQYFEGLVIFFLYLMSIFFNNFQIFLQFC